MISARLLAALALAGGLALSSPVLALDVFEPSFMGCAACQMIVGSLEAEPGAPQAPATVDLSRPCSILPPQDQKGCVQFGAIYGPKFIRAIRQKRAQGVPAGAICGQMGFCQ